MTNSLFMAGLAQHSANATSTRMAAKTASRAAAEARTQTELTRFDIEKLYMITEALWEVLKHQHGYTDDQLVQMIQDIDLRDGKLDGKVAKSGDKKICPNCSRTIIRRQARCLYCGAPAPQQPFER